SRLVKLPSLRRYRYLAPDCGMSDSSTVTVSATAVAPVPLGLVIVALLSISSPSSTDPEMVASKTIWTLPLAGTVMPVMLSWLELDASLLPGGMPTTDRLPRSASRLSTTLTPVAATPAVSVSVIVYRSTSLASASGPFRSETVLVEVDRSENRIVVVSLSLSLDGTLSNSAPDTVALLTTEAPPAAVAPTVSVIGLKLAPSATTAFVVQVTTPPASPQDQPVPVAETKSSPVGSVSVTVVVPDVASGPLLCTCKV